MQAERIFLQPSEWVPNNAVLPVLYYREALDPTEPSSGFERLFAKNGWQGLWRNGIYDYHHYHGRAHEALGVAVGEAQLMIGGPGGIELGLRAGDALVLPAGTGHRKLRASNDFSVVGAYPDGQEPDIQTSAPSVEQLAEIGLVPLPNSDPVQGMVGYLLKAWANGYRA